MLREELLRELALSKDRPKVEARFIQATAELSMRVSDLARLEHALGPRRFAIEEHRFRRSKMRPWQRFWLELLGALPIPDEDEHRLEEMERAVATCQATVASVRGELNALQILDQHIDTLISSWNTECERNLPEYPSLAMLNEHISKLLVTLGRLEDAYQAMTLSQWAAGSAGRLLVQAEEFARRPRDEYESLLVRSKEAALSDEASVALGYAAAELVRAGAATNAAFLATRALGSAKAAATTPRQFSTRATRAAPIEGANSQTSDVVARVGESIEAVGQQLTLCQVELAALQAERHERVTSLIQSLSS